MTASEDTIRLRGRGEAGTGTVTIPEGGTNEQQLRFIEAVRRRQGDPLQEKLDAQKRQLQEDEARNRGQTTPTFYPPPPEENKGGDTVKKFFKKADENYAVGSEDEFYGDVSTDLAEQYGLDPEKHKVDPEDLENEITKRMEGTGLFYGQKMTQAEAEQDYINFLRQSAKEAKARQDYYDDPEKVRKGQEAMDEFSRMFDEYEKDKK